MDYVRLFFISMISIYLMSSPIRSITHKKRSFITDLAYHIENKTSYKLILISAIIFMLPYFIIDILVDSLELIHYGNICIGLNIYISFILEFITLMLTFQSYTTRSKYLERSIIVINVLHIISSIAIIVMSCIHVL